MEEGGLEIDVPRVSIALLLFPQYRDTLIDPRSENSIAASAENRKRTSVGIYERDLVGTEREYPPGHIEISHIEQEERELSSGLMQPTTRYRERQNFCLAST